MIRKKNDQTAPLLTRPELEEKLLTAYSSWYDITKTAPEEAPLIATADYHEHQTGFVLVRKAEMWSADRHEYVFIYSLDTLTKDLFLKCMEQTRTLGEKKVNPESGHMCSSIVALFLCDTAEEEAVTALKKYRYRKSFQFSLKGWMEVHTAVVENGRKSVTANAAGRNTRDFLKKLLVGH